MTMMLILVLLWLAGLTFVVVRHRRQRPDLTAIVRAIQDRDHLIAKAVEALSQPAVMARVRERAVEAQIGPGRERLRARRAQRAERLAARAAAREAK